MKSLKAFIKEKNPALLEEYEQYKVVEKQKEIEKEEKKCEKLRKERKFWYFDYSYETEYSYKGWTDGTSEHFMPFRFAFNLFSNDELGGQLNIVAPGDLGYDEAETFESILEYAGVSEQDLKKEFKQFLYEPDYISLTRYTKNRYDWECRVSSVIEWGGADVWDETHFDEIWNDFKTLHFEEGEEEEDF